MTPDRLVPAGVLLARGLEAQEVHHITGGANTIAFCQLVRIDGGLALAILTDDEFRLIQQELGRAGVPAPHERTRQDILQLIWTLAANHCPETTSLWYNRELHSSCACGLLLRLVEEAWGFDKQQVKQRESESFAKLLGVASAIETP